MKYRVVQNPTGPNTSPGVKEIEADRFQIEGGNLVFYGRDTHRMPSQSTVTPYYDVPKPIAAFGMWLSVEPVKVENEPEKRPTFFGEPIEIDAEATKRSLLGQ